jgi:WD40 repeat protein
MTRILPSVCHYCHRLGYETGGVRIYDIEKYEYFADFEIPKIKDGFAYDYDPSESYFPVTNIRWYTDTQLMLTTGDGQVKIMNIKETDPKRKLRHSLDFKGSGIYGLDIDPDKLFFAIGGMDHNLRVFDFTTMKEKVVYYGSDKEHTEHFNRIFSVIVDPSNTNMIYSGGWDKLIVAHDIRQKHSVRSFMGPYIAADTLDV